MIPIDWVLVRLNMFRYCWFLSLTFLYCFFSFLVWSYFWCRTIIVQSNQDTSLIRPPSSVPWSWSEKGIVLHTPYSNTLSYNFVKFNEVFWEKHIFLLKSSWSCTTSEGCNSSWFKLARRISVYCKIHSITISCAIYKRSKHLGHNLYAKFWWVMCAMFSCWLYM